MLPLLSTQLQVVVVAITVLLVPITVWLWNRVRGPRVAKGMQRVMLIALCQLAAILAVAVLVNDTGYFYGSWSELLGHPDKAVAVTSFNRAPGVPNTQGVMGGEGKIVGPYSHQEGTDPAVDGQVVELRLPGRRSGLEETGYAFLPPEYFQTRFAHYRFPGIEVLTGYPGQAVDLVRTLDFPASLLASERSGEAGPMVLVMLRSSPAFPRDTECVDVPNGPQALTFFAQDVPADIATLLRVRALGWGAIGDSTGGYCAAKLAMTNSYVFGAAVSLSGYFQAIQDQTTGDLFGGSKALRAEADLTRRLQQGEIPSAALLLTTSRTERGPSDLAHLHDFTAASRWPLVIDTLIEKDGGHNFSAWSRELPFALRWLSAHLRVAVPTPHAGGGRQGVA